MDLQGSPAGRVELILASANYGQDQSNVKKHESSAVSCQKKDPL
jgi:hypothetical protein